MNVWVGYARPANGRQVRLHGCQSKAPPNEHFEKTQRTVAVRLEGRSCLRGRLLSPRVGVAPNDKVMCRGVRRMQARLSFPIRETSPTGPYHAYHISPSFVRVARELPGEPLGRRRGR
jgi:hypothetical protein